MQQDRPPSLQYQLARNFHQPYPLPNIERLDAVGSRIDNMRMAGTSNYLVDLPNQHEIDRTPWAGHPYDIYGNRLDLSTHQSAIIPRHRDEYGALNRYNISVRQHGFAPKDFVSDVYYTPEDPNPYLITEDVHPHKSGKGRGYNFHALRRGRNPKYDQPNMGLPGERHNANDIEDAGAVAHMRDPNNVAKLLSGQNALVRNYMHKQQAAMRSMLQHQNRANSSGQGVQPGVLDNKHVPRSWPGQQGRQNMVDEKHIQAGPPPPLPQQQQQQQPPAANMARGPFSNMPNPQMPPPPPPAGGGGPGGPGGPGGDPECCPPTGGTGGGGPGGGGFGPGGPGGPSGPPPSMPPAQQQQQQQPQQPQQQQQQQPQQPQQREFNLQGQELKDRIDAVNNYFADEQYEDAEDKRAAIQEAQNDLDEKDRVTNARERKEIETKNAPTLNVKTLRKTKKTTSESLHDEASKNQHRSTVEQKRRHRAVSSTEETKDQTPPGGAALLGHRTRSAIKFKKNALKGHDMEKKVDSEKEHSIVSKALRASILLAKRRLRTIEEEEKKEEKKSMDERPDHTVLGKRKLLRDVVRSKIKAQKIVDSLDKIPEQMMRAKSKGIIARHAGDAKEKAKIIRQIQDVEERARARQVESAKGKAKILTQIEDVKEKARMRQIESAKGKAKILTQIEDVKEEAKIVQQVQDAKKKAATATHATDVKEAYDNSESVKQVYKTRKEIGLLKGDMKFIQEGIRTSVDITPEAKRKIAKVNRKFIRRINSANRHSNQILHLEYQGMLERNKASPNHNKLRRIATSKLANIQAMSAQMEQANQYQLEIYDLAGLVEK